jgi:superfamily II DNA or RNA helicase
MLIKQIDPIWMQTDQPEKIKPFLKYEKEYWKREGYVRIRKTYQEYLVSKNGIFLAGFLPRILGQFINCELQLSELEINTNKTEPKLKEIKFSPEQLRLINYALEYKRGVLIAPTGYGKTIIALGLMSCFPDSKILFLCHTLTLIKQTLDELSKFEFKNFTQVGGGTKELNGKIIVSTIQSLAKINPIHYCDFDMVIVDECHHISGQGSLYYKVLTNILAPLRFGLTATMPTSQEKLLYIEGLLGPVLDQITLKEGMEKKALAVPKVKIIPIEKCDGLAGINHYQSKNETQEYESKKGIYEIAIVENRIRNREIIKICEEQNSSNKSCLVFVDFIDHGENLLSIGKNTIKNISLVRGSTTAEERNKIKKDLGFKKIKTVIATTVWTEGLNIPSLNTIILAGGGKSTKKLLQMIGRVLRRTEEKETALIIDFADPGKFISEHFVERLKLYLMNKWEIIY